MLTAFFIYWSLVYLDTEITLLLCVAILVMGFLWFVVTEIAIQLSVVEETWLRPGIPFVRRKITRRLTNYIRDGYSRIRRRG
jgi:hypothetical protein